MNSNLTRRLERLECELGGDREVTHAEWVFWSMRPEEWQRSDDPENLDFLRRWKKSKLCRLVEKCMKCSTETGN